MGHVTAKASGTSMAKIKRRAKALGRDDERAAAQRETRPPSTRTPAMHATTLIRSATRAPSSHNTQPWVFRVSGSSIDLLADRSRALPVNDPHDRELTISCGCALMNLRVAGASQGWRADVALLPDSADADWLARASFGRESGAPAAEGALAASIERRRTYRKRFAPREVDAATLTELVAAARAEGAWLRPLRAADARQQVADLVAEGDAVQWADPQWRQELAAWMRPRHRGDGLTVPALAAPVVRWLVRSVNMGGGVAARDRALAAQSPLLAVLGTDGDASPDWLRAGQALQRVLLVACRDGLQASYLNPPIQVADLRPRLRELAGGGFPQLLLRLGYPTEAIPAAPRRAIEQVIAPCPATG